MPALYRQYRPATFAEITGQGHITAILEQEILKEKIAHAYLFQGPRGTGKTTTARVFAKRINCSASKTAEPCNSCDACTAFNEKRSLDVLEIDAASNRGIDDIRSLRETVALAPTNGTYKVYIIDEVHMLSAPAFAALLKTLEEPPRHVVFILATTELHKVPATIASRCQLFRFRRATAEEMHARLTHLLQQEKRDVSPEVISFITARSEGCYRDAESLLGQILSHSQQDISLQDVSDLLGIPAPEMIEQFLSALVASNAKEAAAIATKAYSDGFDPEQFLQESIRAARDGAVRAVTGDNPPAFASAPNALNRITVIMRAFLVALQDIAYVPDPLIALELAILTSCIGSSSAQAPVQRISSPQPATPHATPAPSTRTMPAPKTIDAAASKPASPAMPAPSDASVQHLKSSWEDIVQAVRKDNPVASTFLRATHPLRIQNDTLVLSMQFPLHKTFFEKPPNALIVRQAIKDITGTDLRLACELDRNVPAPAAPRVQQSQGSANAEPAQQEDIVQTVQEIFSAPA